MSTDTTDSNVLEVVTTAIVSFGSQREDVTRDASFEDLDIDSLDLAELAQIIEERFAIKLSGADVKPVKTVGDLVEVILSRAER